MAKAKQNVQQVPILLQPKQEELLALIQRTGKDAATWIGYGGARGGGKSAAIRRVMLARRLLFPGTTGLILRRVYDDVRLNHIEPFWHDYPDLKMAYRVTDHELLLPQGSKIVFGYAETAAEVNRKFWGPEFADIFVDQAEQFTGGELQIIKTANRWPNVPAGFCKLGLFFNPGGAGTEFLRRVFWLKQYLTTERAGDYAFIQAYGWDNYEWFRGQVDIDIRTFYGLSSDERFHLFITQTSEGRKLNSLPPSLRAGHLMGSFESFAGQYYAGVWDESKCILTVAECEALIAPHWTRWISTDWGFAHNAVCVWFASGKVGPKEAAKVLGIETQWPLDVVVVYRELVTSDTPEMELARMIADSTPRDEQKRIQRHFLSPDAFATRGSANTVAEQLDTVFSRYGMPLAEPADNDRIGGWRFLYNLLRQTSGCRVPGGVVEKDRATESPLLFLSANCPHGISSIPLLTRDDKHAGKLEDVLKTDTLADDWADAWRYGAKSMLDPSSRTPKSVRLKEIWDSGMSMTGRAMAMRKFEAEENRRKGRTQFR